MKRTDFEALSNRTKAPELLEAASLANRTPRTLVFGNTVDHHQFHVYLGQDGHIHVLTYRTLHREGESPRFLVLRHQGPPGSEQIVSNHAYLPSMRAFPESCDAEFCNALFETDAFPTFAPFMDECAETREELHGGFAGFTADHPGAIASEMIVRQVRNATRYPQYGSVQHTRLAARLILQAAEDLSIPSASEVNLYAYVPAADSEAVYDRACDYLESIRVLEVTDDSFIRQLLETVFHDTPEARPNKVEVSQGLVRVEIHCGDLPFSEADDDFQYFSRPAGFNDAYGMAGELNGRPFAALRFGDDLAEIRYLQFGDRDVFLRNWMQTYQLTLIDQTVA